MKPFSLISLPVLERHLAAAPALAFAQSWRDPPEPRFAPATVRLGKKGSTLLLFADFVDASVSQAVFPFNFPAFLECDVFEIFLEPLGADFYYELHITPSNSILQLRFPSPRPPKPRDKPLAEFALAEPLFWSATRITPPGWQAAVGIPLKRLCPRVPNEWRASFGRYDYTLGQAAPVISSTSPHSACQFHCREEWRPLNWRALPEL